MLLAPVLTDVLLPLVFIELVLAADWVVTGMFVVTVAIALSSVTVTVITELLTSATEAIVDDVFETIPGVTVTVTKLVTV